VIGSSAASSPIDDKATYPERLIVKYENRRLYDSEACRYITEKDVRELVMKGVPFIIRERRSDVDLTRSVLLRILAAEEGDEPLLPVDVLSKLIRCTDATLRREVNAELATMLTRLAPPPG